MRIVKWHEFKELPEGTIFQKYEPHLLGELMILGSILNMVDFNASPLLPQAMMGDSLSVPADSFVIITPAGFGRDATFDNENRQWLIWDEVDRRRLAGWLLDPDLAISQQNDDPHAMIGVTW